MVPRVGRRQDGENTKDVESALLDGMVVQRRVVATVPEVPVLHYPKAEVYGLADVDARLIVEAQDAVKIDASAFGLDIAAEAL
jgi:hypothetical protein